MIKSSFPNLTLTAATEEPLFIMYIVSGITLITYGN